MATSNQERFKILIDLHLSNPKALRVELSGTLFRFLMKRALGLKNPFDTIKHLDEEDE